MHTKLPMLALATISLVSCATAPAAAPTYPKTQLLLQTETTVIGQDIVYPEGNAEVTASMLVMQPGQETGPHLHKAPLVAHIIAGTLEVDYGPDGTKTYRAGDTFVEALGTRHSGKVTSKEPMRAWVVFMGAEGVPNTVMLND